jgi:hypothetical protein
MLATGLALSGKNCTLVHYMQGKLSSLSLICSYVKVRVIFSSIGTFQNFDNKVSHNYLDLTGAGSARANLE